MTFWVGATAGGKTLDAAFRLDAVVVLFRMIRMGLVAAALLIRCRYCQMNAMMDDMFVVALLALVLLQAKEHNE